MWSWNPHTLLTGLGNSAATLENSLPQNAQNVKYRIILWPRNFTLRIYIPKRNENMYQFSSVAQSRPTLCDPMNRSTPGLPVHHQLLEFTQTHVHRVGDATHPAISFSVIPFSSCPQSLPGSESSPMSQLFTWGGQSIGVSALASVLPMNTQDWSPLEWTGWISLWPKGLSRVFSNTTVQKRLYIYIYTHTHTHTHTHTKTFIPMFIVVFILVPKWKY